MKAAAVKGTQAGSDSGCKASFRFTPAPDFLVMSDIGRDHSTVDTCFPKSPKDGRKRMANLISERIIPVAY